MKVYIAGPMTGLPALNIMAFNRMEDRLRTAGYEPLNPADISLGKGASWLDYMRETTRLLTNADAVVLLYGWEKSSRANVEYAWAYGVGIPVFCESDLAETGYGIIRETLLGGTAA